MFAVVCVIITLKLISLGILSSYVVYLLPVGFPFLLGVGIIVSLIVGSLMPGIAKSKFIWLIWAVALVIVVFLVWNFYAAIRSNEQHSSSELNILGT